MSRSRSDKFLKELVFNVGCILDAKLQKDGKAWSYWYYVEWFENHGHQKNKDLEAYYVPTWVKESEMNSFSADNRRYFINKYNEERRGFTEKGEYIGLPLPVPFWLWQERALYMMRPPAEESQWDPTPDDLNLTCVINVANKLKAGKVPDKNELKFPQNSASAPR